MKEEVKPSDLLSLLRKAGVKTNINEVWQFLNYFGMKRACANDLINFSKELL